MDANRNNPERINPCECIGKLQQPEKRVAHLPPILFAVARNGF
jgi:hypothetical protein